MQLQGWNAALSSAEVLEGKLISDKKHQITLAAAAGDAFGSAEQPTPLSRGIIPPTLTPSPP